MSEFVPPTPAQIHNKICRCSSRDEYLVANLPDSSGGADFGPTNVPRYYNLVWDHSAAGTPATVTVDNPTFTELTLVFCNFSILELNYGPVDSSTVILYNVEMSNTDTTDTSAILLPYRRKQNTYYASLYGNSNNYLGRFETAPPGINFNRCVIATTFSGEEFLRPITFSITAQVNGLKAIGTLIMTSTPIVPRLSNVAYKTILSYSKLNTAGDRIS